jgi:hypothetical protein
MNFLRSVKGCKSNKLKEVRDKDILMEINIY